MEVNHLTKISASVLLTEFIDALYPLRWMIILALILTFVDLRFGVLAAQTRGEKIRFSRMWRRTFNKMADYICWITLAFLFGQAFVQLSIPLIPILILVAIFGLELNSCFSNYFEYRGIKKKIDIFSWLKKKTDIIDIEDKVDN